jgi:hypothetical protein
MSFGSNIMNSAVDPLKNKTLLERYNSITKLEAMQRQEAPTAFKYYYYEHKYSRIKEPFA